MARKLQDQPRREGKMETIVIAATLVGSFAGAFALQKAALEGLFRIMAAPRPSEAQPFRR
jgi:hypothetical protein